MLDIERIRQDFPILKTGLIYFDSASSSLTPEPVINRMLEYYRGYRSNVGRGVYGIAQRATREYELARSKVAKLIGARSRREIIFTKNTTEGINTVASGLPWRKGDKIVTTLLEHHSNYIVWLRLRDRLGVEVEVIRPNEHGELDPSDFEKAVDDRTRLVAVSHVSNVLGTIAPVEEIAKIAHEHGAYLLVDGAQSVPRLEVNVQRLGCDFLAFSGHKMCGPTGIGALYIREQVQSEVEPLCIGGGTIANVTIDRYVLIESPARFEAGTPPIAQAIGLGAAVDYLLNIGLKEVAAHEEHLIKQMIEGLEPIRGIELYGSEAKHRTGILSFNIKGIDPSDVALLLDRKNIAVRSGHHCAWPLVRELCPEGTVRASLYLYNTEEEVEKFVSAVERIARAFAS